MKGEIMKSTTLIVACVLLLISSYSTAAMDAICFNDCLNSGYQAALCREKCSYVDNNSSGFVPSGALGGYFRGLEEARKNEAHELQMERQRLEIERQRLEIERLRRQAPSEQRGFEGLVD
jgi:hypothetical protein